MTDIPKKCEMCRKAEPSLFFGLAHPTHPCSVVVCEACKDRLFAEYQNSKAKGGNPVILRIGSISKPAWDQWKRMEAGIHY